MSRTTLTPSRALRKPRRIDMRAVVGLVLLVLAVVGSIAFWTASSASAQAVLVATHDLPATAVLTEADLTVAHVRMDDTLYRVAIPADELPGLVGKSLSLPVEGRQILVRSHVSPRPAVGPGERVVSIPVTPDAAAGGRMRPGDQVEVRLTVNKGKPDMRTSRLLPRVTVYDVGYEQRVSAVNADSGGTGASAAIKWLSLVLTAEQADALTDARWAGELGVALLPVER